MSARTEMLLNPSMEECVAAAVGRKMPEAEGRKFFYHYESIGWKVGKLPMKSFAAAMGGWFERWMERGGVPSGSANGNGNGHPKPAALSGADKMIKAEEYRRLLDRIRVIQNSYDSHQGLRQCDRTEMVSLRKRQKELRVELGIMI